LATQLAIGADGDLIARPQVAELHFHHDSSGPLDEGAIEKNAAGRLLSPFRKPLKNTP
jgi:hypothetical protein